jgi:hypothetical protein
MATAVRVPLAKLAKQKLFALQPHFAVAIIHSYAVAQLVEALR